VIVFGRSAKHLVGLRWLGIVTALAGANAVAGDFRFEPDTFAFANATVFKYYKGIAFLRRSTPIERNLYTRRCFVMTRAALQFHKFARFDPHGASLNDNELAARVRAVTRYAPWRQALPDAQRVVLPGYANLRQLSKARPTLLQENIGLGWPTYLRFGNFRMFFQRSVPYQEQTHARLDAALARGDFFVTYLTTYPRLSINHSVLIYARTTRDSSSEVERYLVYDPNHPEAPRQLTWSASERSFAYQKDSDFIGGPVRVYQVYGKWLQ